MRGRPSKLTDEQLAEAERRYRLWEANRPYKIAMQLGVDQWTLCKAMKRHRERRGRV